MSALVDYGRRQTATYNDSADHNSIGGDVQVVMVKAVTEKMGNFDRAGFADTLHGLMITTAMEPRIMRDTSSDATGEMNRQTWMMQVVDGRQTTIETLGPLMA